MRGKLLLCDFTFVDSAASSYGMTENAATCAKTWPGDTNASGTIGPPQAVNEVKLIDIPAMNYTSEDKPNPRGELLVRGVNCFTTYYKGIFSFEYPVT